MYPFEIDSGGLLYTRISKPAARKLWSSGAIVAAVPHKLRPGAPWYPECHGYHCTDIGETHAETFEKWCNAATYYKCNAETGRYLAFYAVKEV